MKPCDRQLMGASDEMARVSVKVFVESGVHAARVQ
jgi:hypothetical protein